jgi:hypothetical protein
MQHYTKLTSSPLVFALWRSCICGPPRPDDQGVHRSPRVFLAEGVAKWVVPAGSENPCTGSTCSLPTCHWKICWHGRYQAGCVLSG